MGLILFLGSPKWNPKHLPLLPSEHGPGIQFTNQTQGRTEWATKGKRCRESISPSKRVAEVSSLQGGPSWHGSRHSEEGVVVASLSAWWGCSKGDERFPLRAVLQMILDCSWGPAFSLILSTCWKRRGLPETLLLGSSSDIFSQSNCWCLKVKLLTVVFCHTENFHL